MRGLRHRFCLSLIDTFIYPSPIFVDSLDTKLFKYTSKMYFVPNGVDTIRFRPVNLFEKNDIKKELSICRESFVILFVGHFSKDKGLEDLLNALSQLSSSLKNNHITLIIIGSQDPLHYEVDINVVNLFNNYSNNNFTNIDIINLNNTNEIEKYYKCSDLYVLCSRREGMPNSLLEAMSSGVPVISTFIKGITNCIIESNLNGVLYDCGNYLQLRDSIQTIMNSPNLANKMGKLGRIKIIKEFDIKNNLTSN